MGHERVGVLPKTKRWRDVVRQIATLPEAEFDISDLSRKTIENVRSRFRHIEIDDGVKAAFTFLVALATASKRQEPQKQLVNLGIQIPANPTAIALAKSLQKWVNSNINSLEYGEIAQSAAVDTIAFWYNKNRTTQETLFKTNPDPFEVWRKASDGSGFCELARAFFAKFTERYMNYFLEREASTALKNLDERDRFHKKLQEHIDQISHHAFETAKITQSFAAGWFNKNAKQGVPEQKAIQGFLAIAFGKIREELMREASA